MNRYQPPRFAARAAPKTRPTTNPGIALSRRASASVEPCPRPLPKAQPEDQSGDDGESQREEAGMEPDRGDRCAATLVGSLTDDHIVGEQPANQAVNGTDDQPEDEGAYQAED